MLIITPEEIQRHIKQWKNIGVKSIGFVPTMGALHQGHLSLLQHAKADNEKTIVSIFVNPLQFNNIDDYNKYPRNIDDDAALLEKHGCDIIMHGQVNDFFPSAQSLDDILLLTPGKIADELEGEHRPGHFAGVKTIVTRLFEIIGNNCPCTAYFGEKDYQQTKVVEEIAAMLGYPEVRVCPIVRDKSGLALSSRNQRLSFDELTKASHIYKAMQKAANNLSKHPQATNASLIDIMQRHLLDNNIEVEYVAIKDDENWYNTAEKFNQPRALIAANVGDVRLIDNMLLKDA